MANYSEVKFGSLIDISPDELDQVMAPTWRSSTQVMADERPSNSQEPISMLTKAVEALASRIEERDSRLEDRISELNGRILAVENSWLSSQNSPARSGEKQSTGRQHVGDDELMTALEIENRAR